ncbi:Uu.00g000550.m01.CDS01 [Anthostomella pinea]|uniref:Uu.00g000550.m01.CDS01 n=1 Tax=Anthostomella pinea TaxID=933095 RepID=A0AAI8YIB9_9PEZI|nr:Uu.00g000550.m01.CDS01 [Anthostomella pinea]
MFFAVTPHGPYIASNMGRSLVLLKDPDSATHQIRDAQEWLPRTAIKYGRTFRTHPLGTPTIKIMDTDITKYVHATYFDHFGVEKIRSGIEYL